MIPDSLEVARVVEMVGVTQATKDDMVGGREVGAI